MRSAANARRWVVARCVLLVGAVLVLGGCGLFGRRATTPPVVTAIPRQVQLQYAQAESRLASPDADVRQQAAVSLLSMDHPDALPTVLDRMRHAPDAQVRISMIRAAAFLDDHRCFEAVLDDVEDPDPKVRDEAARALARFTRPQEVEAMVARAGQVNAQGQQLIYSALGEGLDLSAVPALLEGLGSGDKQVQASAWEALKRISGREFPPQQEPWQQWWEANSGRTREDILEEHLQDMTAQLESRSGELQSLQEQQAQLMKLVQSPQADTPQRLIEALASHYDVVRQYAASRLAGLSDEQARSVRIDDKNTYMTLAEALDDPSEAVRQNVLRFGLHAEGDYRPRLIQKALYDEDPTVLTLAINAVDTSAGQPVTARLEDLLAQSSDAGVREAAANVLGKAGLQSSAPALMAALEDPAENVRWFAVEGLRKLGAVQAVPRICEMLQKDPSARVREIAASTLGELGQPAGVPALRQALDDANDRVRQKASAALLALATDNYERMAIIAGAFREKGLYPQAAQVLTNIIKTYRDDKEMRDDVTDSYKALAEVELQQKDYAAAAATYQELDGFLGGSAEVRGQIVSTYLEAGDPARVAAAVEEWFKAAGDTRDRALIEVGLDAAERLYAAGFQAQGAAVLQLVQQAGAETLDPGLAARIQKLQKPAAP